MVGAGRFGLPTSASRTLRANQTALRPDFVLYCKVQRPERCALTRLRYSPKFIFYCKYQRPERCALTRLRYSPQEHQYIIEGIGV
jgi:hypothetical protein